MNKKRILIVDDMEVNRAILQMAFSSEYTVLSADNGLTALEKMRTERVDLVVTDMMMEPMDGLQLIKAIRMDPRWKRLPVLAVTEHDQVQQKMVLEAGADDFILKPFVSELLQHRVRSVMEGSGLRATLEKFAHFFDENPLSFAMLQLRRDASGQVTGFAVEYANRALCDMFSQKEELVLNTERDISGAPGFSAFLQQVNQENRKRIYTCYDVKYSLYLEITAYREEENLIACVVTDVTERIRQERRQAERDVYESQITLGTLCVRNQPGFPLCYISRPALRDLGYESQSAFMLSNDGLLENAMHPDDVSAACAQLREQLAAGDCYSLTFRLRRRDGGYIWLRQSGRRKLEEGEEQLVSSCQDVTADLRARAELTSILDNLSVGIAVYRCQDGVYTLEQVNPVLCHLRGRSEQEMEYRDLAEMTRFVHPEDVQTALVFLNDLFVEKKRASMTFRMRNATTGEYADLKCSGVSVDKADGSKRVYISYTDIREQKLAEATVRRQAEYMRRQAIYQKKLFDTLPSGVARYRCRADGKDAQCIYYNRAACRIYSSNEVRCEELGTASMLDKVFPADRAYVAGLLERLGNGEEDLPFENRVLKKDGSFAWISGMISHIEGENGEPLLQTVYHDVTSLKQAMAELKRSQESLDAAVKHSDLEYWEVELPAGRAILGAKSRGLYQLNQVIEDFPEAWLRSGNVHPDDVETYRQKCRLLFAGEPYAEWDGRFRDAKTGEFVWKRVRYTTLMDGEKRPVRAIATAQNIDAYKELEARFVHMLVINGIWAWDYDLRRRCIINIPYEGICDPFGLQPGTIPDAPETVVQMGMVHPEDTAQYKALYTRMSAGEKRVSAQLRLYNKEKNEYIWNEMIFETVEDVNGTPVCALCSTRDISTMRKAQQLYEEEQEFMRNAGEELLTTCRVNLTRNQTEEFHSSLPRPDGALPQPSTDYRTRMSELFDEISLSEEEARSLSPGALLAAAQKGTRDLSLEYVGHRRSGEDYLWVQVDCKLLRRPDTDDWIAFFYNRDISARHFRTAVMDTVLEADYDYVGVLLEKNGHLHSMAQSPEYGELSDKILDYETTLAHVLECYVPDCREKEKLRTELALENVTAVLKNQTVYTVQFGVQNKSAAVRRKQVRVLYHQRERGVLVISCADVEEMLSAERRQQERLTAALNLAERASAAKSEFLARVSHEIRTPMNAILGLTELAQGETGDLTGIQRDLERIHQSGTHLMSLINDVLDMSKMESGEFQLHPVLCTKDEFCQGLVPMIQPLCEEKNIVFVRECLCNTPPIFADRLRLNQIFLNLLSNAVKYTPRGGRVGLRFQTRQQEGRLYLNAEVFDNGIGMSEEFQKHMFEPFTQESNVVTAATQGTGLGLSIVKGIVDRMGGTIAVHSRPGEGTTFTVKLDFPLADPVAKAESTQEEGLERLKGKTVLVVEDHPLNQMILKRLLGNCGMRVLVAENGKAGVGAFQSSAPYEIQLILMDVRMPIMDGLSAARAIRALSRADSGTVPIVAMTANAFDEDRQNSSAAGMNDHLSKPVDGRTLYRALLRNLHQDGEK